MSSHQLQSTAAKLVLQLTSAEALPAVAADELADGRDSPSLRELAALPPGDVAAARKLFERSLEELGVELPSSREAVMLVAGETAARILDGTTTPYEGAREISDMALLLDEEDLPELDTFVYAASEWDARPSDANVFAEGVVAAAQDLVRNRTETRDSR